MADIHGEKKFIASALKYMFVFSSIFPAFDNVLQHSDDYTDLTTNCNRSEGLVWL